MEDKVTGKRYFYNMKIVDTRGNPCPAPLIATRSALKEAKASERFEVMTDSPNAFRNISTFLTDNNISFSASGGEGLWILTITKDQ
ncbi:MAG: sulfurtransferase TusA family protein [Bacteroidales bacterium]